MPELDRHRKQVEDGSYPLHFTAKRDSTTGLGQLCTELSEVVEYEIGDGSVLAQKYYESCTGVEIAQLSSGV